jgi:hypothetical protein
VPQKHRLQFKPLVRTQGVRDSVERWRATATWSSNGRKSDGIDKLSMMETRSRKVQTTRQNYTNKFSGVTKTALTPKENGSHSNSRESVVSSATHTSEVRSTILGRWKHGERKIHHPSGIRWSNRSSCDGPVGEGAPRNYSKLWEAHGANDMRLARIFKLMASPNTDIDFMISPFSS